MSALRRLWNRMLGWGASEPVQLLSEPRLVVSRPLFQLSPRLLAELRRLRESRGHDSIASEHEAFLLDGGLGPPAYLSADGRVIWDDDIWGVLGTRRDALAALAAGIKKTGLEELRELLPVRSSDGVDCQNCQGSGLFDGHGTLVDVSGKPFSVVCNVCAGLGWTAPSLDLDEKLSSGA